MTTRLRHIERHQFDEERWHNLVDCIFMDPKSSGGMLLDTMNDVDWLVITTVPHNLNLYYFYFILFLINCML